jgi:PilZ domain
VDNCVTHLLMGYGLCQKSLTFVSFLSHNNGRDVIVIVGMGNLMGTKEKDKDFHYGIIDFERRGYPRVKVRLPIEYRRVDSATKQSARTGNVSEGGFGIFFPERLEIGEQLKVKLFLSSGPSLVTIDALVEIVWMDMEAVEGSGEYRSGVKFVDISEEAMSKLKAFLRDLLR